MDRLSRLGERKEKGGAYFYNSGMGFLYLKAAGAEAPWDATLRSLVIDV